jgi:hypothetical protein
MSSAIEFGGSAFTAEAPTSKSKEFWASRQPPPLGDSAGTPMAGTGGQPAETAAEWRNATRTDEFQQLPKMPPSHDTIIVKDRSYFDGSYLESLPRNRFDAKLKHNLDNWARDQELRRQVLDWQASEAHAVDLLAQKEYSQARTRDRKVERIHLETCSGAYFVRPSDNQLLEGIDEPSLATRTNAETASLLKTLATQQPLDALRAQRGEVRAEARQTLDELAEFDARMGLGGAGDDSDDE